MDAAKLGSRINPFKLWVGSFLPNWLLQRRELSAGAKLCYSRLAQYAGEHGVAYPKQATLAAELGITDRQLRTHLAALVRWGLIAIERPHRHRAARYTFHLHPWMAGGRQRSDRKETSGPVRKETSALGVRPSNDRARVDSKRIKLRGSPGWRSRSLARDSGASPRAPRSRGDRKPKGPAPIPKREPIPDAAREVLNRLGILSFGKGPPKILLK